MAISRLNTFFAKHHRWIFGIFTVFIIVAFTDFLVPGTGIIDTIRGIRSTSDAGTIFGKKVSYNEVREQAYIDTLRYMVFMGVPISSDTRDRISEMAFGTLAQLRAAESMGIQVTEPEVARFLRIFFSDASGKFNADVYRNYVENVLVRDGFSEQDLNVAAEQYLTLSKLQQTVQSNVVVTPGELELYRKMMCEEFQVYRAKFDEKDYATAVTVADDALAAYFETVRDNYIVPAQLEGEIVTFAYDDYAVAAQKALTEEALLAFYNANPALFSTVSKDGKTEVKPYDSVKNEVRKNAAAAKARELAMHAAQGFAAAAYEAVSGAPQDGYAAFGKLIAAQRLKTQKTGVFSADSVQAGTIAEPELVKEMANVYPNIPVSNAVGGKTGAYVGFVTRLDASRRAEMSEVADAVRKVYVQQQAVELARARAAEVVAKLSEVPLEGRLDRVKAAKNPVFTKEAPFSRQEAELQGSSAWSQAEMQSAMLLNPGEISSVLMTPNGAEILVLESRGLSAEIPSEMEALLERSYRGLKNWEAQLAFEAFLSTNCVRFSEAQ